MDSLSFYKSLYERELKRRHDIEGSISPILTILSTIVAILYFFNKNTKFDLCDFDSSLPSFLLIAILISFLTSLYYLCKGFNNFFNGFFYENLPKLKELRDIELSLKENSNDFFESKIIDNLIEITDKNKSINDFRGEMFHKTRSFIILTFILSIIQLTIKSIFEIL